MRRVSILIALCALVGLCLTLAAQSNDIHAIMTQVGPTNNALRMDVMSKDAAKTQADADKLEGLFKDASTFFKSKSIADATDWANSAAMAAADASKAAKANNFDDVAKAAKTIGGTCKTCHDVHREQLPDKTFKLKP